MTPDQVERFIKLGSQSTQEQMELNKTSINNQIDAADRLVMRKAAETVMELAKSADPT